MLFSDAKKAIYRFIRRRAFCEGVRNSLNTAKAILCCIGQEVLMGDGSTVELEILQDEWWDRRFDVILTEKGGWHTRHVFTVWFDRESFETRPGGVSYVTVDGLERTFNTEKFVAFIALESEREIFKFNRYYLGNQYAKVAFIDDIDAFCRP